MLDLRRAGAGDSVHGRKRERAEESADESRLQLDKGSETDDASVCASPEGVPEHALARATPAASGEAEAEAEAEEAGAAGAGAGPAASAAPTAAATTAAAGGDGATDDAAEPALRNTGDQVSLVGVVVLESGGLLSFQGSWLYQGRPMGKFHYSSCSGGAEAEGSEAGVRRATASANAAAAAAEAAADAVENSALAGNTASGSTSSTCSSETAASAAAGKQRAAALGAQCARVWSGSFTMANPAFELRKRKRSTCRRFLTVSERFEWSATLGEASSGAHAAGAPAAAAHLLVGSGRNRFGRFTIKGELSLESGALSLLKEYCPKGADEASDEDAQSPGLLAAGQRGRAAAAAAAAASQAVGGTRASKRQRVPNRKLLEEAAEQGHASLARHGGGAGLTSSELTTAIRSYQKQRAEAEARALELSIELDEEAFERSLGPAEAAAAAAAAGGLLRDVHAVLRRPLDADKARKVRALAKRKLPSLMQRAARLRAAGVSLAAEEAEQLLLQWDLQSEGGALTAQQQQQQAAHTAPRRKAPPAHVLSRHTQLQARAAETQAAAQAVCPPPSYLGELAQPGAVRSGLGVAVLESGHVLEAQWRAGACVGRGALYSPQGELLYMGDLVDGAAHGRGTQFFASGDRYDGEFRDGLFHGYGVHFDAATGETYHGDWKRGRREGHGALDAPGGSSLVGDWAADRPNGRAHLVCNAPAYADHAAPRLDHQQQQQQDEHCEAQAHLHLGKQGLQPGGMAYEGFFKAGCFDGRGLARYEGQGEFEGTFRGGCKEGRGTFKFPNAAVYEGRFKNDRLDGSGTLKIEREQAIRVADAEWILPVSQQCEMKFVHRAAGFDEQGL
jgi:hypothetical protein